MSIQYINTGTGANAGNGDSLRLAFTKVNSNFDTLASQLQSVFTSTGTGTSTGISHAVISLSPPLSPIDGELWYDDAYGRLYIYYDNSWIDASPSIRQKGFTGSAGRGFQGYTGSSGLGYTGSTGAGYTGSTGDVGVSGYTGSVGIGYTGSTGAGYTGSTGDVGVSGYTGSVGIGYTGSTGFGIQGYTGSQGSPGDPGGYTGSAGKGFNFLGDWTSGSYSPGDVVTYQGVTYLCVSYWGGYPPNYTFPNGAWEIISGPAGYTGSIGVAGSIGTRGYTGSAGIGGGGGSGYVGSAGSSGYVGSAGLNGYVGSAGSSGYVGSAGLNGYVGSAGSGASRKGALGQTAGIDNNATDILTISGIAKTYVLLQIETNVAAWVRLYTNSTSQSADISRAQTADPLPGTGIIAEAITSSTSLFVDITPGVIGFNANAGSPTSDIYATVTNLSGMHTSVLVNLTVLPLES